MMMNSMTRKAYLAGAAALTAAALPWPLAAQTLPMLKVGAGKIEPQAEAYYGADSGIFTKFGLDVDVQTLANAGVTSSAVAGGDLQIGATTCLNIAQAREHNLPFIGVVPGAVQAAHQNNGGLIVAPNSPIATAKGLNGKSIAIETLNGLAALTIKAMVDQAGGDSSTLQFVEMGGALMTDAVLTGRVPGAYLQDPFYTQNLSRIRSLGSPNDAVGGTYVSIVWFTTTDWLAKNKDTARKFANAIYASGQWAMSNPQLAAASLDKHLGIKVPAATQRFATQLDISAFRRLFDLAAKYKFIAPVDPATVIWNGK
jgi:ABC-type nitrate/sulfonate/bicarbonate transport system substrate-binding protein